MSFKFNNKKSKQKDLIEFNKEMRKEFPENFEVDWNIGKTFVDLNNQKIFVNGKEVNTGLKSKLNNPRWISFRRNTVSYRMSGSKNYYTKWGFGFQGNNSQGRNIKRYVLFDDKGNFELRKD